MAFRPPNFNGVPIPYDASVAELSVMIEAPGPERWAAFEVLARKDSEEALNVLAGTAQASDPYVRRAAIAAIGEHEKGSSIADLVCDRIQDSSDFVARAACEAAAALELHAAHDAVFEKLGDASPETRIVAVQALKVLWNEGDFEKLFKIAQDDRDERAKKAAAYTLRARASKANWYGLFDAWQRDPLPRHRTWAGELAERFGDPRVIPALTRLSADNDGHVRKAAVRALAAIPDQGQTER